MYGARVRVQGHAGIFVSCGWMLGRNSWGNPRQEPYMHHMWGAI